MMQKKVTEILPMQAMKLPALLAMQAVKLPSTTNTAATPATNTNNTTTTTRSNDSYVYGVGMFAVFAIGVCVFFAYNTSQAENKKQVNKKQDQ